MWDDHKFYIRINDVWKEKIFEAYNILWLE